MDKRKFVFQALVGSNNYNLATPQSDKDYKVFVLPTFDDLYYGKMISGESVSDDADYNTHDIRRLPQLLWKSNINFVEVLFSQSLMVGDGFEPFVEDLLKHRNALATMNLPYLYNACKGMALRRYKDMTKTTGERKDTVLKLGYDPKAFSTAIRVLDFLFHMSRNGFDFGDAIFYANDNPQRLYQLRLKQGYYTRDEAMEIFRKHDERTDKLRDLFLSQPTNLDEKEWLDDRIKALVKGGIKWVK